MAGSISIGISSIISHTKPLLSAASSNNQDVDEDDNDYDDVAAEKIEMEIE